MTETSPTQDQPRGNFIANMVNPGKSRQGKSRPNVRGAISAPGSDRELKISLWTNEYPDADGKMMMGMNGNVDSVSRDDSPMDQFRSHARGAAGPTVKIDRIPGKPPIELEDGKIAIFQSKNKDGQQAANGNLRTDFYGFWNDGGKLVEIGAWLYKNKETGQAFLGGATQHPIKGREQGAPDFGTMSRDDLERMQANATDLEQPEQEHEGPSRAKPEKPVRRSSRFLEDDVRSR